MAYLPQQSKLPSAYQVQMPFKAGPLLQSVMLPHEVFSTLCHQYPGYWRSCFLPGGGQGEPSGHSLGWVVSLGLLVYGFWFGGFDV